MRLPAILGSMSTRNLMTNRVSQRGIKVTIDSIPLINSNPFIKCDKHYKIFHNIHSPTLSSNIISIMDLNISKGVLMVQYISVRT